jgi:hypothetical protein
MGKSQTQGQRATSGYEVGRRIGGMGGFDMTQPESAERIGISQNYLSTMESRQGGNLGRDLVLDQSGVCEKC